MESEVDMAARAMDDRHEELQAHEVLFNVTPESLYCVPTTAVPDQCALVSAAGDEQEMRQVGSETSLRSRRALARNLCAPRSTAATAI